jgi:hypothetical protein
MTIKTQNAVGTDPLAKQKLVSNERLKLSATALNNASVAAFITSVVAPATANLYGNGVPKSPYWWMFGACWLADSAGLHFAARRIIGDLEP